MEETTFTAETLNTVAEGIMQKTFFRARMRPGDRPKIEISSNIRYMYIQPDGVSCGPVMLKTIEDLLRGEDLSAKELHLSPAAIEALRTDQRDQLIRNNLDLDFDANVTQGIESDRG